MPDKVNGVKTKFSTWKMVYRVLKDLIERPDFDDPPTIVMCLVLVSHAWIRVFPILMQIGGYPDFLDPIFELLRQVSRSVLEKIFEFFMNNFQEIVFEGVRNKGFDVYTSNKPV